MNDGPSTMTRDPHARDDATAYDRYLAGMDASMRQKVALTAAHLLAAGSLADMGMGSGTGSEALAALYPGLDVVGVDLDPTMVERAAARFSLPNLRFQVGDIAQRCFPDASLDAILDSSVLHHVTTFGGYDRGNAARALAVQAEALVDHGVLVVRDFLDPGPGPVWLDVRADDGDDGDDPRSCSTAALTRRFSREFRSLRPPTGRGFPLREVAPGPGDPPLAPGFLRFALDRMHAVEMVLRKDYRRDWEAEVQEEYTYLTQAEFEAVFARLGLRVLASTPIRNPWIVQHRFEGKLALWDAATGEPLDWPATNYVIVGQRVPDGAGVGFRARPRVEPCHYLGVSCWERRTDGVVFDLARRPGFAVDVVPWFLRGGAVHVLARRSYPRPILALLGGPAIDGATPPTWVSAPLNVLITDVPLGEAVADQLTTLPGVEEADLLAFEPGTRYLPSPGGVEEEVRSVFVQVRPLDVTAEPRRRGFSDAGHVRAIEASQLLRAAQVGGLPDARLELNVYDLLLRRGDPVGAWIGAEVGVPEGPAPLRCATVAELAARPPRRAFVRADAGRSTGFLAVSGYHFEELDRDGRVVGDVALDVVLPSRHRAESVAVAVLRRYEGELWLGVDDDDLPAVQCFDGRSDLLVTPAWRLPQAVGSLYALSRFVRERLLAEHGVTVGGPEVALGGSYHPSPGVTPEIVHPLAVVVAGEAPDAPRALTWVPLADAVRHRDALVDGHLRVIALRAAHALGVIG